MIIDFHTHYQISPDHDIIREMDKTGIEKSLVLAVPDHKIYAGINIDGTNNGALTSHVIYAVDYNRFISAVNDGTLKLKDESEQTYYELCDDKIGLYARVIYVCEDGSKLYFNVYLDEILDSDKIYRKHGNVINLQDNNYRNITKKSLDKIIEVSTAGDEKQIRENEHNE